MVWLSLPPCGQGLYLKSFSYGCVYVSISCALCNKYCRSCCYYSLKLSSNLYHFDVLLVFSSIVELIQSFLLVFVHFQAQTESCDVKLELEKIHQDVTLPVSIIYKDDDTLAHPSVSWATRPDFTLRFSYFSICFCCHQRHRRLHRSGVVWHYSLHSIVDHSIVDYSLLTCLQTDDEVQEETLNSNNAPWGLPVIYLHWQNWVIPWCMQIATPPHPPHIHTVTHSTNKHLQHFKQADVWLQYAPGGAPSSAPAPLPIRTDESH